MLARKVIQWTVVLLLLIAAAGGVAVHEVWKRKDELLLEVIRTQVEEQAPDWDVGIEQAKIVDVRGQVRLRDISIKPKGETTAVVHIPECFITLDPDLWVKQRQILIRHVRVLHPTVTFIRHEDGTWNWQKLGRLKPSQQTPEVVVEHGEFIVRIEATGGLPETEIASREVALNLSSGGMRRYLVEGASQIDGAGGLSFTGRMDLNSGAWELAGKADGLDLSPALLEKAAALSPAVKRQVVELSQPGETSTPKAVPEWSAESNGDVIRPVSQSQLAEEESLVPDAAPRLSLPNLGLIANIGLEFELRSDGVQLIPDYRVIAKIMEGQVTKPLSPVPLSGLEGELLIENDRIVIHQVSAANGESQLFLDGEILKRDGETVKRFQVHAKNLWLDPQVRDLLSPELQRMFDLVNPAGRFTVKASYDSEAEKPLQLDQFTALDCTMRHAMFPYLITGITGTIQQAADRLIIDLQGTAAERPVHIDGEVRDFGSQGEAVIRVQADQFPIDRRFTAAIVLDHHQPARQAIEALNLTGLADLRVQFARKSGADQRFVMSVDADLSQAAMSYQGFPYEIEHLSGHVHYDPWKEPIWRFTGLQGRHGPTTLDGEARFDLTQQPGELTLTLNARNAQLDQQLRQATETADPALKTVWSALNPSGWIHVNGLELTWVPGSLPRVVLPSVRLEQGTVILSSFPFRWDDVTADLSWRDGRVDLRKVEGRHNETYVVIEGRMQEDPAFFELADKQGYNWLLRLPVITVRNLDPGGEFAGAIPPDAAAVLKNLDPRGPIDADIWVEMKGWPDEQWGEIVTSAWRLGVDLNQDRLYAGLELTDVTGRVEATLKWDGERVTADGDIDFQRARTLDMTCTDVRGPISVDGTTVTVGSPAVLRDLTVSSTEQLTASLYDGTVKINAIAQFDPNDTERSVYQVQIDLDDADLQQWAGEWGLAESNATGTVNGRMNLHGQGTSPLALKGENCWMQITDARLGELPVMAQLLTQITQLQQPDSTAFRHAYAKFSVAGGRFEFGSPVSQGRGDDRVILLDGKMLKMVGWGVIPFAPGIDPRMNLTFLSKASERNRWFPKVPFISQIASSMVDNWIRIQVTGTPSEPNIIVGTQVPIGNVNDVLRDFLSTLESGLNPVLPRPVPPSAGP